MSGEGSVGRGGNPQAKYVGFFWSKGGDMRVYLNNEVLTAKVVQNLHLRNWKGGFDTEALGRELLEKT